MAKLSDIQQLVAYVEGQRAERLEEWRQLSALILPSRGIFHGENRTGLRNKTIWNNAANRALRRAAAGLTSGMTPANLPWFKHDFMDQQQREVTGARTYVDVVDHRLEAALAMGGFYQAIHAFNREFIAFGTALLYSEAARTVPVRYRCCTIGTWAVALDDEDALSFVCHRMRFTAKALAARFGERNLSPVAQQALKDRPYHEIEVVQAVERRDSVWESPQNVLVPWERMPWASYWYEAHGADQFLAEGGYMEMPYHFTRWDEARGVYGTGPGDEAISDQRALDTAEFYKSLGTEKTIDPPILIPGALKGRLNTNPGGQVAVSSIQGNQIAPMYQIDFMRGVQALQQEIQVITQRLNDTLYASVFQSIPLDQRTPGMTATEVLERRREALQEMGPALSAYEPAVLNTVLERTYAILDRQGFIPPPPPALGPYATLDVEYQSPLAQALRQTDSDSIQALLQTVVPLANAKQEILDKIDFDQVVDETSHSLGVLGSIVRSDEQVAEIRQNRAAQEQAMQQAQQAREQLDSIAKVAPISTKDTLAGALLGGGNSNGGEANAA